MAALSYAVLARPEPEALSTLLGLVELGGAAACAVNLSRANVTRRALGAPALAILGELGAVAALHALYYIAQSQDFMVADFMRNRLTSYAVAQRIGGGRLLELLALLAASLKEDYSWLPALPTGSRDGGECAAVARRLSGPLSRCSTSVQRCSRLAC